MSAAGRELVHSATAWVEAKTDLDNARDVLERARTEVETASETERRVRAELVEDCHLGPMKKSLTIGVGDQVMVVTDDNTGGSIELLDVVR